MLVSLNWLKEFVDIRLKPADLAHRLTMGGFEVEAVTSHGDDTLFELNITPNRGDCLSMIGVAREVAAITGAHLKMKPSAMKTGSKAGSRIKGRLSVEVADRSRCVRYCARIIEGVRIAPSPAWLSERLSSCGIRSINNVVDATNYVMLETGQPFHAFDNRFIRGGRITVDTPKKEMDFATLDGVQRKIIKEDLLINDEEGPIALAGVMGGANSEVRPDTATIVIESACFDPVTVRRTAKRLGLQSESSKRFEKGVDAVSTLANMNRLIDLIVSIAGGNPTVDWIDVYPKAVKPAKVKFSLKDANSLLGTDIKAEQAKKYLKSLGVGMVGESCTIPTTRPDLARPADLIEEVARLYGYDNIPVTVPKMSMSSMIKPLGRNETESSKEFLTAHGFFEAVNYGFCSPSELEPFTKDVPITISNPLGIEFSAMKPTLVPGLLKNLKLNLNMGQESMRLFEMRPVFIEKNGVRSEERRIAGVMFGPRSSLNWAYRPETVDYYDVKGVCQGLAEQLGLSNLSFGTTDLRFMHPQASSALIFNGKDAGYCGLLHPAIAEKLDIKGDIFVFELKWDEWIQAIGNVKRSFKRLDKFPTVRRDMALLVGEDVSSDSIVKAVADFNGRIIKGTMPFDVYKGKGIPEGKKSVAYAVVYSDPERTLTDDEVSEIHARLIGYLKDKLGAEVR